MSMDTWPLDYDYPVELNRYVYAAANPVTYVDPSGYSIVTQGRCSSYAIVATGALAALPGSYCAITPSCYQQAYGDLLDLIDALTIADDLRDLVDDVSDGDTTDDADDDTNKPLVAILGSGANLGEILNIIAARPRHRFVIIDISTQAIKLLDLDIGDNSSVRLISGDFSEPDILGDDRGDVIEIFSIRPNSNSFTAIGAFAKNNLMNGGHIYAALNSTDGPASFRASLSSVVSWTIDSRVITQKQLVNGDNAVGIKFPLGNQQYDTSGRINEFVGIR